MREGDEQRKSSRGGDEIGRTGGGREGVKAEGRRRSRRLEETRVVGKSELSVLETEQPGWTKGL